MTDELYETVLTNLDKDVYPPEKLRELYASRWGIETSFRDLKYTVGMLRFSFQKGDVYPSRNIRTSNYCITLQK